MLNRSCWLYVLNLRLFLKGGSQDACAYKRDSFIRPRIALSGHARLDNLSSPIMVSFSNICMAFAAAAGTRAVPATANHGPLTLFTELKQQPSMWKSEGAADKGVMITAQIGLKQSNIPGLQAKLLDVSNPESPNYGKWLSQEQIAAFTAPAAGNVEAVKAWLAANDIMETTQPTNE